MLFQIGILSPQGGFDAHKERLEEAYGNAAEVHDAGSLSDLSGLILSGEDPGALREALQASNLFEPLREFGRQRPILATGAAVCLVVQESLGLMNIGVDCAGYEGRIDRLTESLRHEFDDESGALQCFFIRPPRISWIGPEVRVFAKYRGEPVLVEEGLHMAATFHPELSRDRRIYSYFVDKVRENYWKLRLSKG